MIKSTLKVIGKLYEAEGKTIREALLNLDPLKPKGVGVLTMTSEKASKTIILQPRILSQIYDKMMSRMFKERAIDGVIARFDKNLFEDTIIVTENIDNLAELIIKAKTNKSVKNKKVETGKIAPFEITHEANILRKTSDGGFVTDEFIPIKKVKKRKSKINAK